MTPVVGGGVIRGVPPSIMVLGPGVWGSDDTRFVSVLRAEMTPLEARQHVRRVLDDYVPVVVMEDELPDDPAVFMHKLLDVVEANNVRTFLLVVPLGARHNGIDVECGYLLTRLLDPAHAARLRPNDIAILAEHDLARLGEKDGILSWSEPGNRTRYYQDFVALGVPLKRWLSIDALEAHALSAAIEHRQRHPESRKHDSESDDIVVRLVERPPRDQIITVEDLSQAIQNRIGLEEDGAMRDAEFVMGLFGFDDRVLNSVLEPEDRQLLYILEEEGLLTTEREETTLHDGSQWLTHYWIFRKDNILASADAQRRKDAEKPR